MVGRTSANSTRPSAATAPEATGSDTTGSALVDTVMPSAPLVAAPIVRPLMVMVKADALIDAPDVVITKDVAVVALQLAVSPATLLAPAATMGVTEEAKKPAGKVSVMVPLEGRDVTGVKAKVMDTPVLKARRSDVAMANESIATDALGAESQNFRSDNPLTFVGVFMHLS